MPWRSSECCWRFHKALRVAKWALFPLSFALHAASRNKQNSRAAVKLWRFSGQPVTLHDSRKSNLTYMNRLLPAWSPGLAFCYLFLVRIHYEVWSIRCRWVWLHHHPLCCLFMLVVMYWSYMALSYSYPDHFVTTSAELDFVRYLSLCGPIGRWVGLWCLSCLLGRNCCGRAPQWGVRLARLTFWRASSLMDTGTETHAP